MEMRGLSCKTQYVPAYSVDMERSHVHVSFGPRNIHARYAVLICSQRPARMPLATSERGLRAVLSCTCLWRSLGKALGAAGGLCELSFSFKMQSMMMLNRSLAADYGVSVVSSPCATNGTISSLSRPQLMVCTGPKSRSVVLKSHSGLNAGDRGHSAFLAGQGIKLLPLKRSTSLKSISSRIRIKAQAYEANKDEAFQSTPDETQNQIAPAPTVNRLKIGTYFVTWWALNVVFNIYNKKVLNAYPYPWLTSTLSLAAGSAMMFASWATGLIAAPDTDIEFWKALFPVALAHTIGHVAATVSMSKVAVSFTHIIKSAEPAFSVVIQRLIMGEHFPLPVYLSLVPIIGGCGLAALTELNFNMTGFMGAMISNIAFVFRNIFSKKGMKAGKAVGGLNYYACLSILSLVLLTPFAIAMEGPQQWVSGWNTAVQTIGPHFVWWVVAQSVFYHLYNQVSYMSLDQISPLTFSIGNTMKRVTVIVSSILIFHTPVRPINAVGAAIAILGTFLYSQAKQ